MLVRVPVSWVVCIVLEHGECLPYYCRVNFCFWLLCELWSLHYVLNASRAVVLQSPAFFGTTMLPLTRHSAQSSCFSSSVIFFLLTQSYTRAVLSRIVRPNHLLRTMFFSFTKTCYTHLLHTLLSQVYCWFICLWQLKSNIRNIIYSSP